MGGDISGQKNKLGQSKKKKRIFGPKIGKKFENKVQKLSNFKEKRTFFAQKTSSDFTPIQEDDRQHKKQAGNELKNKKRSFWAKILINLEFKGQKLTKSQKKKDISGQKNKPGLSLRTKKGLFWAKILKKIEFKGQKLTNIKKKDFLGPKNKLGQSLRRKKGFLGRKLEKNLRIRSKSLVI